jgi:peptidoglycan/LPS O-acetylase OafA/YrhL
MPWELTMYAGLTLLGVLALGARPRLTPHGVRSTMIAIALAAALGQGLNEGLALSTRFEVVQGLRLLALFTTAGCMQLFRDRIPMGGWWFAGALVLLPASVLVGGFAIALYPVALVYVVLWLGYCPSGVLRLHNRLGDYSYGFYLWQFPIEQWVVERSPGIAQWKLVALAGPVAIAVAVLSWHLVEAPMLAIKDRAPRARDDRARLAR